jgi:hypothetical protein
MIGSWNARYAIFVVQVPSQVLRKEPKLMTDNELRAHDLTILYIQEMTRLKTANAKSNSDSNAEVRIDYYSDYIELYPKMLEKINKQFP